MVKCIEIKPRYIDANEINWQQVEYEYGKRNNTIIACEIAVDETPEVDVAPVIHAHKVRAHSQGGGTHWVVCSHCEKPIDWQDAYCKHCGAKMDEEVNK